MTPQIQRLNKVIQYLTYSLAAFCIIIANYDPPKWANIVVLVWLIPIFLLAIKCTVLEWREMNRWAAEQQKKWKNIKLQSGLENRVE